MYSIFRIIGAFGGLYSRSITRGGWGSSTIGVGLTRSMVVIIFLGSPKLLSVKSFPSLTMLFQTIRQSMVVNGFSESSIVKCLDTNLWFKEY